MRFTLYLQDARPRLAVHHFELWFDTAELGSGCPESVEELTLAGAAHSWSSRRQLRPVRHPRFRKMANALSRAMSAPSPWRSKEVA